MSHSLTILLPSAACFSTFLPSLLSIHVSPWFCGCGFCCALSLNPALHSGPCLCCPCMQSAARAAAWAPGPRWPTHTGGALSSEKPPSTQVILSVSLHVCLSVSSHLSCSVFIFCLLQPIHRHSFLFCLCGLSPPLSVLLCVISLSGTSQSAALLFLISLFFLPTPRLSLSIMASNYPEAHSF